MKPKAVLIFVIFASCLLLAAWALRNTEYTAFALTGLGFIILFGFWFVVLRSIEKRKGTDNDDRTISE